MSGGRAVCYLRVSTARQGASGLGLEAQRTAVMAYVAAHGMTVAAEFVEVESGKRDDRPQLAAALAACRLHRAQLVIAKLDRLARNVAFIANLMDGGVDFVACDMPHANRLTLHILAAMAEHEREMISQRTKAALAAAKARGVRLGNPNGAAHLRDGAREAAAASARSRQASARAFSSAVAPVISGLRDDGINSFQAIARELNRLELPASRGGRWCAQQVRRLLA
ncbi:MAG: recombinase family protein [Alphaproteobacteria bacterium]|nr:MAG: recombinase family protein [Alphaproteobacteria bacterium]